MPRPTHRRPSHPRRALQRWLVAVPMVAAMAFVLRLWQTNGQLLYQFRSTEYGMRHANLSVSGLFGIPEVLAQSCGDPAAPLAGNGALYYNACAGKFRMWAASGPWQDLVASLWAISADGQDIYPTQPVRLKLDPSSLASFAGREAILVNVSTAAMGTTPANDLAVLRALNVPRFALWSDTKNSWADLVAGRINASSLYTCTDPADSASCTIVSGGGPAQVLWAYENADDLASAIKNTNLLQTGNSGAGGNVRVTRSLTVRGNLELDAAATVVTEREPISGEDLAGTPADLSAVWGKPDGSYAIAVGEGGAMFRSTNGGVSWAQVLLNTTANLNAVAGSAQANLVVAVGDYETAATGNGAVVAVSYDGGQSWEVQRLDAGGSGYDWHAVWVQGDGSRVLVFGHVNQSGGRNYQVGVAEANGTITFTSRLANASAGFTDINLTEVEDMAGPTSGSYVLLSVSNQIFRSVNGGLNWSLVYTLPGSSVDLKAVWTSPDGVVAAATPRSYTSSANRVVLVSMNQGQNFVSYPVAQSSGTPVDIFGTDDGAYLFIAFYQRYIDRYDRQQNDSYSVGWSTQLPASSGRVPRALWIASSGTVLVAGDRPSGSPPPPPYITVHRSASSLNPSFSLQTDVSFSSLLQGVLVRADNSEAVAVGNFGKVRVRGPSYPGSGGTSWVLANVDSTNKPNLYGVHGTTSAASAGVVVAVGDGGRVYQSSWGALTSWTGTAGLVSGNTLRAAWVSDTGNLRVAVGDKSSVAWSAGGGAWATGAPVPRAGSLDVNLYGVYGVSTGTAWRMYAVGQTRGGSSGSRKAVAYTCTTPSLTTACASWSLAFTYNGADSAFYGVGAADASNVYAVGKHGAAALLYRYDGAAWNAANLGGASMSSPLYSVWVATLNSKVVVFAAGIVESGTGQNLFYTLDVATAVWQKGTFGSATVYGVHGYVGTGGSTGAVYGVASTNSIYKLPLGDVSMGNITANYNVWDATSCTPGGNCTAAGNVDLQAACPNGSYIIEIYQDRTTKTIVGAKCARL